MSNNTNYYEQESLWEPDIYKTDELQQRATLMKSFIPNDVRKVIDVGCGNGLIINKLVDEFQCWGLDISQTALKQIKATPIHGSIENIPFEDNYFDIVICAEVLEHLPVAVYSKGLSELQRVSKKYILISTPYKENLQTRQTKCAECGCIYNIYHHLRSYDEIELSKLFEDFKVIKFELCGNVERQYNSWDLWWKQNLGNNWVVNDIAMCPQCGSQKAKPFKWNLSSLIGEISYRILPREKTQKWIIALYEKC